MDFLHLQYKDLMSHWHHSKTCITKINIFEQRLHKSLFTSRQKSPQDCHMAQAGNINSFSSQIKHMVIQPNGLHWFFQSVFLACQTRYMRFRIIVQSKLMPNFFSSAAKPCPAKPSYERGKIAKPGGKIISNERSSWTVSMLAGYAEQNQTRCQALQSAKDIWQLPKYLSYVCHKNSSC